MILKLLKTFLAITIFINASITFAADIDHYKVVVNPTKVAVGEAVDLTITAVDKNDNVIKDYDGTVLIYSESDKKAEFPKSLEFNSYKFKKSDEGSVKFENGVKFSKPGKNDIHISDLNSQTDSIFGLAEVEVTEKVVQKKVDINILTPPTGTTIGKKSINVSGKSDKNHQIKLVLNNKENILTTTNRDGIFEKEIDGLENGNNSIKAYILDADGNEIGESKEILIKSDSSFPVFNKLKLTPSWDVQVNRKIKAEVYASKGLDEVSLVINENLNILKESKEGVYNGEFLAPKKEGEYKIDVVLKNELGTKLEKKAVQTLKVIPEIKSAEEPKIKKDKCPNGDYTGDVFDGKCGKKPADYKAPLDLGIRNLRIVKLKTKSVLMWDKLDDAIKYKIYKKMAGGKLELIDTITDNKYDIEITGDKIKYEYFAVKAIGKQEFTDSKDNTKKINKEVEGDLSDAVKIQTGPKEILIIFLALLLGFGILFIGKRNKAK